MRNTTTLTLLALTLALPADLLAEGKTRDQLAMEIVSQLQTDDQFDEMMESIVSMQQQVLKGSKAAEGDARAEGLLKELNTTLKGEFSKTMKQDMAAAYAAVFTAEELQGLVDFYATPVGKKYVDKLPELNRKSMELQQKTFGKMWPKIEKAMHKYMSRQVGQ